MAVRVERVEGRRGVSRFIDVAWRVQAGRGTLWVPPLRMAVRDSLDTKGNPFYRDADLALFIATRDGRPVKDSKSILKLRRLLEKIKTPSGASSRAVSVSNAA